MDSGAHRRPRSRHQQHAGTPSGSSVHPIGSYRQQPADSAPTYPQYDPLQGPHGLPSSHDPNFSLYQHQFEVPQHLPQLQDHTSVYNAPAYSLFGQGGLQYYDSQHHQDILSDYFARMSVSNQAPLYQEAQTSSSQRATSSGSVGSPVNASYSSGPAFDVSDDAESSDNDANEAEKRLVELVEMQFRSHWNVIHDHSIVTSAQAMANDVFRVEVDLNMKSTPGSVLAHVVLPLLYPLTPTSKSRLEWRLSMLRQLYHDIHKIQALTGPFSPQDRLEERRRLAGVAIYQIDNLPVCVADARTKLEHKRGESVRYFRRFINQKYGIEPPNALDLGQFDAETLTKFAKEYGSSAPIPIVEIGGGRRIPAFTGRGDMLRSLNEYLRKRDLEVSEELLQSVADRAFVLDQSR